MKHSSVFFQLFRLSILILTLSACQSTPPVTRSPDTARQPAEAVARAYSPQADAGPSAAQSLLADFPLVYGNDDVRLQQAASLFQTGSPGLALDMLGSIEDDSLESDQRTRKRIMQAAILLQAGGNIQAQQILTGAAESYQPATLAVFYLVRAKASMAQGQTADTLKTLVKREQFLAADEIEENQRLIWNILMLADTRQLRMIQQMEISAELAGWVELAMIIKKGGSITSTEQKYCYQLMSYCLKLPESTFPGPANCLVVQIDCADIFTENPRDFSFDQVITMHKIIRAIIRPAFHDHLVLFDIV